MKKKKRNFKTSNKFKKMMRKLLSTNKIKT